MNDFQKVQIVHGRLENALTTTILVAYCVCGWYLMHPAEKIKHKAILLQYIRRLKHWISIKETLAEIQDLPETET